MLDFGGQGRLQGRSGQVLRKVGNAAPSDTEVSDGRLSSADCFGGVSASSPESSLPPGNAALIGLSLHNQCQQPLLSFGKYGGCAGVSFPGTCPGSGSWQAGAGANLGVVQSPAAPPEPGHGVRSRGRAVRIRTTKRLLCVKTNRGGAASRRPPFEPAFVRIRSAGKRCRCHRRPTRHSSDSGSRHPAA